MWVWIVGFVVVCTVIAVVIARRGPGYADHSSDPTRNGAYGGFGFGGGGGDGGGSG